MHNPIENAELTKQAKQIYSTRLRAPLEPNQRGMFVAIEPKSGDYYLGRSLSEAIQNARETHPNRRPFVMRVGERTAIQFGVGQ